MAAHVITVMHIIRKASPQLVEYPFIILVVELSFVVSECALALSVRLRMPDAAMDESDSKVTTEGRNKTAFEIRAVVEQHRFGDRLVLAHGRDQRSNGYEHVHFAEEITKDICARAIIEQCDLVG